MKKYCFILLIIILIGGCSNNEDKITDKDLSEGSYIVTPTTLFKSEEMKKLKPHLNLRTGCVEIKYKGDKERIKTKYEIWKNGKLETSNDNIGMNVVKNNEKEDFYKSIVSISIKDNLLLDNSEPSKDMIVTTAIGGSSIRQIIDRYNINYSSAEFNLRGPIKMKDSDEIAIWALVGMDESKNRGYSPELTIEETIKNVDWALVLKVYFE